MTQEVRLQDCTVQRVNSCFLTLLKNNKKEFNGFSQYDTLSKQNKQSFRYRVSSPTLQ